MEPFRSVNLSNVADEELDVFLYHHLLSVKAFPISISSRYPEKKNTECWTGICIAFTDMVSVILSYYVPFPRLSVCDIMWIH